jgi:hypothetical protein
LQGQTKTCVFLANRLEGGTDQILAMLERTIFQIISSEALMEKIINGNIKKCKAVSAHLAYISSYDNCYTDVFKYNIIIFLQTHPILYKK